MRIQTFFLIFLLLLTSSYAHSESLDTAEMTMPGTHHIEAIPTTLDGQVLPDMDITVTVDNGEEQKLHTMFSAFYHYGANVELQEGSIIVWHLDPPTFTRGADQKDLWTMPRTYTTVWNGQQGVIDTAEFEDMTVRFEVYQAKSMFVTEAGLAEHEGHMMMEESHDHESEMEAMQAAVEAQRWFYWQTWAALLLGLLFGSVVMWAAMHEKRK